MTATLFHLHATSGSGPDTIGFEQAGSPPFLVKAVEPKQSCLVSWSPVVVRQRPSKDVVYCAAQARVQESEEMTFYFTMERPLPFYMPFWSALTQREGDVNLSIQQLSINVLGGVRVEGAEGYAAANKKCHVRLSIPILTNAQRQNPGTLLKYSAGSKAGGINIQPMDCV